jgi:hypothetical protein
MNDRGTTRIGRHGFGATFLEALHESRRRQAAREIHEHRHLINEAKGNRTLRAITCPGEEGLGTGHSVNSQSLFRRMSVEVKILIGAFVFFAVLHVIGVM